MKYIFFIFCITLAIAQKNGIRTLNGSLENSQRLTVDTTSSATFRWGLSNGVHTLYLPYRIVNPSGSSFKWNVSGQTAKYDSLRLIAGSNVSLTQSGNTVTIATSGGGSVGNADSLGGVPASDYARLSVANTFTQRNTFPSVAVDTVVGKSTGNTLYIQDTVNIKGKLTVGTENQNNGYDQSYIFGYRDSILSTTTSSRGQNYIFGNNNTIGRTNPTGAYGNWLFGQYLRSEVLGLWAMGSDDSFGKQPIPLQGTIAFINEKVVHWANNTLGLGDGWLSYGLQTPRVKDTVMYGFRYAKLGSATDALAYGAVSYQAIRGFTYSGNTLSYDGTKVLGIWAHNVSDDNSWHFNNYNSSGRPFGNIYVDSAHFIVSQGYADADSFRLNGSTFLNSTALSLGSKTVTTTGSGTFGALNINRSSTAGFSILNYQTASTTKWNVGTRNNASESMAWFYSPQSVSPLVLDTNGTGTFRRGVVAQTAQFGVSQNTSLVTFTISNYSGTTKASIDSNGNGSFGALSGTTITASSYVDGDDSVFTSSADSWMGAEAGGITPRLAFVKASGFGPELRFLSSSASLFTVRRVTGGTLLAPSASTVDMQIGATGNVAWSGGNHSGMGTISSGAITSTGLSTFGDNAGTATIGAGDSVQVTVTGLTVATGQAVVSYKRKGATSVIVADTIATYDINTANKLSIYGKYGWTVSYWVGKK